MQFWRTPAHVQLNSNILHPVHEWVVFVPHICSVATCFTEALKNTVLEGADSLLLCMREMSQGLRATIQFFLKFLSLQHGVILK